MRLSVDGWSESYLVQDFFFLYSASGWHCMNRVVNAERKDKEKGMIVVLRLRKWENSMKVSNGPNIRVDIQTTMSGFLPVYPNMKTARKYYPKGQFRKMERDNG